MNLRELLRQKRDGIVGEWIDRTLTIYPSDAAKFLKGVRDQFSNPMGTTISEELGVLYDALLRDAPAEEVSPALDRIVQITCIQQVPPSRAVSFIFELKGVIRRQLNAALGDVQQLSCFVDFESAIDQLALQGFESCARYYQRIAQIRNREAQRKVWTLMRMLKVDWDDLPTSENSDGGCGR